jgi:hypothetical protein
MTVHRGSTWRDHLINRKIIIMKDLVCGEDHKKNEEGSGRKRDARWVRRI